MESQVNPNTIQDRAEKLATAEAEVKTEVVAPVIPEVKPEVKAEVKPEVKVEPVVEKPIPNDPAELRKWNTKISQENAAIKDEVKNLRVAIDKLMKKPVDYKELAKNPEALQKQIEVERQEAIAEMQEQLQEATNRAVMNETAVERIKREQDTASYPEWKRLFPVIQNLASNTDGRINFNKKPGEVLDDMYQLALQLSPVQVVVPVTPLAPVVPGKSEAEIAAEIAAAEKRGFDKAQASLRAEQAGAGIGSTGTGGKRSSGVSSEALRTMPLGDLKKIISQQ